MAGGRARGAETPLHGAHRGPGPTVEA
jgi:hypothetical protein